MQILVCVKQTFDTEARISLTREGQIDDSTALLITNPYDEYAVEEAIRIKEKVGGEVTVITIGGDKALKTLRHCLAMGADHAILVDGHHLKRADGHVYARVLAQVICTLEYDLILCGRESVDMAESQVQTRLAEILDLPQINTVSFLKIENGKVEACRDIEKGTESIEVDLPALISVQKGINEIRYPSLRLVMKASKHPVKKISLQDISLTPDDVNPYLNIQEYQFPKVRRVGRRLAGNVSEITGEIIEYLRSETRSIRIEEL